MRQRSIASRLSRAAVAGALALAFPLVGLALDRTSGATLTVTVHSDRYVAADVAFLDLDALAALVSPMNPTVLRLEACGAGSAGALLAAAERFHGSYIEMSVLAAADPSCTAAPLRAIRVSQVAGPVPVAAASVPSQEYWRRVMP